MPLFAASVAEDIRQFVVDSKSIAKNLEKGRIGWAEAAGIVSHVLGSGDDGSTTCSSKRSLKPRIKKSATQFVAANTEPNVSGELVNNYDFRLSTFTPNHF